MRRGVSLPTNALVVLVMAIIVLVALIAVFFGTSTPGKQTTDFQAQLRTECVKQVSILGCQSTDTAVGTAVTKALSDRKVCDDDPDPPIPKCLGAEDAQKACCG